MRSRREVVGEVRIVADKAHDFRGGAVAVFADQRVDTRVFTKAFEARRQDDQFTGIGNGHAGAVDRLVAQPGGVELFGI